MPAAAPANRPLARARRSRQPFLLLVLPAFLVVVVIALFCVRAWVYGFLRSEDFRHFLDRKASAVIHAGGSFQPLHWQDAEVYSDAFDATGSPASPFSKLSVQQVRARLDLHALWERVWRVETLQIEKLAATVSGPHPAATDNEPAAKVEPSAPSGEGQGRGFLAGLLPGRVDVEEVRVNELALDWNGGQITGSRLVARPREGGPQNWEINGTGGRLEEAHFPAVRLTTYNVKSSAREIFLTRAEGQAENGGRLDLSGRQALDGDRALDLTANFDRLPVAEFLPADWRARLHGSASGNVRVTGSASSPGGWHALGHVDLRDGRLEALPVLDELATFTATERFRQAPVQKGRADFDWIPSGVKVSNLFVESEGLLRIEGGFVVSGDQIDGTFQVGVARSSLRWIAVLGAQVFNLPERDGYVWTTTRVSGSVRHPSEDLTPRMIAAAQQSIIDKAKQGASTVLDTASGLLDLLKRP